MFELNDFEKQILNSSVEKSKHVFYTNLQECSVSSYNYDYSLKDENQKYKFKEFVCFCKSENKPQTVNLSNAWNRRDCCIYCGTQFSTNGYGKKIYTKKQAAEIKERFDVTIPTTTTIENVLFLRKSNVSKGSFVLILAGVSTSLKEIDQETFSLQNEYKIRSFVEIVPTLTYQGYSNKEMPINIYNALGINATNCLKKKLIIEGYTGLFHFFEENQEFYKKTGFSEILKYYNPISFGEYQVSAEVLFLLYIALISEFPVIEMVVKAGMHNIVFNLFQDIIASNKKTDMLCKIKLLEKLINKNETKGSLAITIPSYICTYLNNKNANMKEYIAWCDIFERTRIGKEGFENLINTREFALINSFSFSQYQKKSSVCDLPNIIKFDYSLDKLYRYLLKQYYLINENSDQDIKKDPVGLMRDYLNMCDIHGLQIDKYPQNIETFHNNVQKFATSKENEEIDQKIKKVHKKCTEAIENYYKTLPLDKVTQADSTYVVKIPLDINELYEEGINQNNCVGSYIKYIADNEKIIFFIRKKEDPEESLITAEVTKDGLGQLMYKNNVHVSDSSIINFAKKISTILQKKFI